MSDEVIDALALPNQINYLHLPVQSGSDEVLRRMNRKYTRERFLDIIAKVKARRPGIAIGTDIIVGFPGETAQQFEETVSMYREVDFDIAYQAEYSTRSGTLAEKMFPDDVPAAEKTRRWRVLQDLMEETTLRKNQATVGKTVDVLVGQVADGFAVGTTNELKSCRFPCEDPSFFGSIVRVLVAEAREWQLTGGMLR
jgi:tRNA-2-methylthio-N6-dimethylallyladenosine synthase